MATLAQAGDPARTIGVPVIYLESRTGGIVLTRIQTARDKAVDSIVVGKCGTRRVAGLLLVSVSRQMVSLAQVPVTVVP